MAYALIRATLGQSLGDGRYNSSAAPVGDKVTAAVSAAAAVTANATVAADPTALGLAQASDAAIAVVKSGDLVVLYDTSTVSDVNKLKSALRAVVLAATGIA